MEQFDYQPNLLAGSLRKKKTGTIGLIIPDSSNMLFAKLSRCIEDNLFSKNYNIIVCNSAYDVRREIEHLKTLRSKMVDGILIIPATLTGEHLEKIKKAGIPIIILDRFLPDSSLDTILVDNYRGGYEAAEYLIKLGHRNIGYIDRIYDHSHSLKRKEGFMDVLKANSLSINKDNIIRGGFTFYEGVESVRMLIKNNPNLTAIFAFNDINALGAIRGLIDLGFRVPEDVSVMGMDDIMLSDIYIPRLSTVHYPVDEMARVASKLLQKRIEGPIFKKIEEITIPIKLIIRESTSRVKNL